MTLFNEKKDALNESQERYDRGLERLKATSAAIEKFQSLLDMKAPELHEKQIQIQKLMEKLKEEHEFLGKKRDMIKKEEEEIEE